MLVSAALLATAACSKNNNNGDGDPHADDGTKPASLLWKTGGLHPVGDLTPVGQMLVGAVTVGRDLFVLGLDAATGSGSPPASTFATTRSPAYGI